MIGFEKEFGNLGQMSPDYYESGRHIRQDRSLKNRSDSRHGASGADHRIAGESLPYMLKQIETKGRRR